MATKKKSSGRTAVAKKKSSRKATAKSRGDAQALFMEAVGRASQGFLFDAIGLFRAAIKANPKGEFADDALFDIGHCYLRMQLLNDAEKTFTELLRKYPDATINCVLGGREQGRTAAKALLGRARARLKLGDLEGAQKDVRKLADYPDSTASDVEGNRRSFHELGVALLTDAAS